jgi:hypothetical protein
VSRPWPAPRVSGHGAQHVELDPVEMHVAVEATYLSI